MGLVVAGHLSSTAAWQCLQGGQGAGVLGVCGGILWVLLGGSLGRTAVAAITSSATAGLAIRACGELLGDEPNAHLLVVMQDRG